MSYINRPTPVVPSVQTFGLQFLKIVTRILTPVLLFTILSLIEANAGVTKVNQIGGKRTSIGQGARDRLVAWIASAVLDPKGLDTTASERSNGATTNAQIGELSWKLMGGRSSRIVGSGVFGVQ